VDTHVEVGTPYEYQVVKTSGDHSAYGYIYSGINVPMTDSRGTLLLVVDNTYATELDKELTRLHEDLAGDGWNVTRIDVGRNDSPVSVKRLIQAQYNADPAHVKAVFLFGHVPVPYSGDIVPDGHAPDHEGAWPCDGFYGDMTGRWTDSAVNDTRALDPRNRNVPGDGKFDQSTFPAPVKLMVGRVDLSNLPGRLALGGPATFPNELELLRNYLNKDHKFRAAQLPLPRRAVVGDFFGTRDGEAFAASAWRNFAPFFGPASITEVSREGSWISNLHTNAYLWAYGCGAGSYTSVAGLGNSDSYHDGVTTELFTNDIKAAFTLLFGSWLPDWDSEDDIMRSVLALPGYGLTCASSGRPHWFFQHMALGEPIGFSTRLTQNNGPDGLYKNQLNSCARQVHIALMGDPTLRMHPVEPPSNVTVARDGSKTTLTWSPSSDSVVGYHVYSSPTLQGPFTRLTSVPVACSGFTDPSPTGAANYMVRAVKLETSASGSYYNPSQGAFLLPFGTASDAAGLAATGGNTPAKHANKPQTPTALAATNTPAIPSTATGNTVTNNVVWIDDKLPAGAQSDQSGGDSWNWVSSNPSPYSGTVAHQSAIASGLHQHFFTGATSTLNIQTGDVLFAAVYIDPANVPSEIMLQWNVNGSWEHRAYWGANNIQWGVNGTASLRNLGAIPAAGQWVLLQIPASAVGLEGASVSGMAFTLYGGRATWDYTGDSAISVVSNPITTNPPTTTVSNSVAWVDDSVPASAVTDAGGGDSWNWVSSNPSPYSGSRAHQSAVASGLHQHFFTGTSAPLNIRTGDVIFCAVFIDPANVPSELMLQWNVNGSWEHRAYWGANNVQWGVNGTSSLRNMGPLPATGQWVLLQIPASSVGLEGTSVSGMAFTLYGGRATWDYTGDTSMTTVTNPPATNAPPVTNGSSVVAWMDDSAPTGARTDSGGGDSWNWVSSNPTAYSGSLACQSAVASGLHQVFFTGATQPLNVSSGDVLFAYVYIDPANVPSEIMLQWNVNGSWEHRAFWGANNIQWGVNGTSSLRNMGSLPAAGQWALLQVPASQVGLEGAVVNGMAFSLYGGRATWDYVGKASAGSPISGGTNSGGINTGDSGSSTNGASSGGTNTAGSGTSTNNPGTGDSSGSSAGINSSNATSVCNADYITPELPNVGDSALHLLTPTLLELKLINTKQPDPAPVTCWNFVDSSGNFAAPAASKFTVTVNGQTVGVSGVAFKRRPLWAPLETYDLRIENCLYLQLASPVADNASVQVTNPDGSLWAATTQFTTSADPLRFSPAIHVNQEGYVPNNTKKAMVGYYAGSLGEMTIPTSGGFQIVDANTGQQVFQGSLTPRADVGWNYAPTPYQKVYEADFSSFTTPGEYRLVVPGMGGSLPFLIDSGVAMSFARAYALGLYHQRCGTNTAMPYTRFEHGVCHSAPASVPASSTAYPFTWNTVSNYAIQVNSDNPVQTAPKLTSPAAQLFPYINQGPIDVSGGHHDAGDYSKYTCNVANLVHLLMFSADSLQGVSALDNLGIPESGDGISDVMQEAKWEADFLAKMQDADGGFYFLVYPVNREYEGGVTPDHGDPQVVWPKNTSATAASVAALAQCASSPLLKAAYPAAAALYLQKAKLGWQFLMNAINKYGKTGAYQKITHYGDTHADQDELAWAACQMYLATGDQSIHQLLLSWFNPSDPATTRYGWWHMNECYGHCIRSYAFAVQSGRASASQLDPTFLAKCQSEIAIAASNAVTWSQQSAYGTSFPGATKAVQGAGWYFSAAQAFDLAVGYQLNPSQAYMDAMLANVNYEGGCNPVNSCYLTGLGWRRTRDIVSQWHSATTAYILPPTGIPVGNVDAGFPYNYVYNSVLSELCYPSDGASTAPYPFYDRWGDSWNVTAEMTVGDQGRGLGTVAFLAAQTQLKTQPWKAVAGQINIPSNPVSGDSPLTLSMSAPGIDLTGARITWEVTNREPAFGQSFTYTPNGAGTQCVQAEAQLSDGRRVFAITSFTTTSTNSYWVDDTLPLGATPVSEGDPWTWVGANPTPHTGSLAHQSALAAGIHQHYFENATATLSLGTGDSIYTWVYLDPYNMPSEIMLQWNDGGGWEHRAYWGANNMAWGTDGTASRYYVGPLPTGGQWVKLTVPASAVGLEGKNLTGMAFALFGGRATWDTTGKTSATPGSTVSVNATSNASRAGLQPGIFTFTRTGATTNALAVNYALSGSATSGLDYNTVPSGLPPPAVTIPAGAASATVTINPLSSSNSVPTKTVTLTLSSATNNSYGVSPSNSASLFLLGNSVSPTAFKVNSNGASLTWPSISNAVYHVSYKNKLTDPAWTTLSGDLTALSTTNSWRDTSAASSPTRFYIITRVR
jgi:hypothetical protein